MVRQNKNIIDKSMTFKEIIKKNPEAEKVLTSKGMHCVGCPAAAIETLEQGAIMHGIDADKVTEEINSKLKNKKSK